jgi:chemotaxis signal transduction protein
MRRKPDGQRFQTLYRLYSPGGEVCSRPSRCGRGQGAARAPNYFAGIINFHGALVAVLDLAMFFEAQPGASGEKILVLDRSIANLAFLVDMVEDIISEEVVLEEREGGDAMTASVLVMADGEVKLLAVRNILEKLEAVLNG